jgi:hypothetical protein
MMALAYTLDANVIMQACRDSYPFSIAPGFWDALWDERVGSIDRVLKEIHTPDELVAWAKDCPTAYWAPTDSEHVIAAYREVVTWANGQERLLESARESFFRSADSWVIAYAKANSLVVVTQERPSPNSKARLKIPDVCAGLGVEWTNLIELLARLGVRLIRG